MRHRRIARQCRPPRALERRRVDDADVVEGQAVDLAQEPAGDVHALRAAADDEPLEGRRGREEAQEEQGARHVRLRLQTRRAVVARLKAMKSAPCAAAASNPEG